MISVFARNYDGEKFLRRNFSTCRAMVLIVVLLVEADTSRLLVDRDISMFELLEMGGISKVLEEVAISMFLVEQDRQSSYCHNIWGWLSLWNFDVEVMFLPPQS